MAGLTSTEFCSNQRLPNSDCVPPLFSEKTAVQLELLLDCP